MARHADVTGLSAHPRPAGFGCTPSAQIEWGCAKREQNEKKTK